MGRTGQAGDSGVELSDVKIKTERAMGHRLSMASSGWGDTTTNRESAQSPGDSVGKGVDGKCSRAVALQTWWATQEEVGGSGGGGG